MRVDVLIYLEHGKDGAIWWSESPQVPGFHATESSLQALMVLSEKTIYEVLERMDLEFRHSLVGSPPHTTGRPSFVPDSPDVHRNLNPGIPAVRVCA